MGPGAHHVLYSEVCSPDDSARVFCPPEKMDEKVWSRGEAFREWANMSVWSDLSEWKCSAFKKSAGPVSYYSGFDDGSLCDCGSPFILYTRAYEIIFVKIKFNG